MNRTPEHARRKHEAATGHAGAKKNVGSWQGGEERSLAAQAETLVINFFQHFHL